MVGDIDTVRIKNKIKDILYIFRLLDVVTGSMDFLKRYLRLIRMRWNCFRNGKLSNRFDLDPYKVIEIDPEKVKKYMSRDDYFDIWRYAGKILDGDWDLLNNDFEKHIIYRSLKAYLKEGKSWKDTDYYESLKEKLEREERGRNHQRKTVDKRVKERGELYRKLYRSIEKYGYKTQEQLVDEEPLDGFFERGQEVYSEITVNIGRKGDFILNDGRHRFACAKLLDLNKIPVRVLVRHEKWQTFREELKNLLDEKNNGRSFFPIPHTDLDSIQHLHDPSPILDVIKENIRTENRSILDLTSTVDGYFLYEFERKGYEAIGIVDDKQSKYSLEKLRDANEMKFMVIVEEEIDEDFFTQRYGAALCFDFFERYLSSEKRYRSFLDFVENLKIDEIFIRLDPSIKVDSDLEWSDLSEENIIDSIIDVSCLEDHERLISDSEIGTIFRLTA